MRTSPPGLTKSAAVAIPKAIQDRICVGGVITVASYQSAVFVLNYGVLLPSENKSKTLEDFRSPNGVISLTSENYEEVLSLSNLDSLHKGFVRTYFNQAQNGILPSAKYLAGWIKSKNKKIKIDDDLLVIKFLLDLETAGFSVLSVFDEPTLNKVFMAYSKSPKLQTTFKEVCSILNIQNEKSEIKFASEIFNKLKANTKLVESLSLLGVDSNQFLGFLSSLKEDAFNYLAEKEKSSLEVVVNSLPVVEGSSADKGLTDTVKVEVLEKDLPVESTKDGVIVDLKCDFLDELGIVYRSGIPSQHYIATTYTAVGNSNKRAKLHEVFHNFNMKHILPIEVQYLNGRKLRLFLPVAVCKKILHEISEKAQSSYNLSQWIK